jgi:hypothetical protein
MAIFITPISSVTSLRGLREAASYRSRYGVGALFLFSLLVIFGIASLLTRAVLWLLHKIVEERLAIGVETLVLGLKTPFFCLIVAIMERLAGGYAITALRRHYWRSAAGFVLASVRVAWLLVRLPDILIGFVGDDYGQIPNATDARIGKLDFKWGCIEDSRPDATSRFGI